LIFAKPAQIPLESGCAAVKVCKILSRWLVRPARQEAALGGVAQKTQWFVSARQWMVGGERAVGGKVCTQCMGWPQCGQVGGGAGAGAKLQVAAVAINGSLRVSAASNSRARVKRGRLPTAKRPK
jgi:hypothetical protein